MRTQSSICLPNKVHKHIFIGDINLNKVDWPEGTSSNQLQMKFVNLFNDLGFLQLIHEPTHEDGNTLDLLWCNSTQIISDLVVMKPNVICQSDHFGILFSISANVKRLKCPKRTMFNFKKADWANLNTALKNISWKNHLCFCDSQTA